MSKRKPVNDDKPRRGYARSAGELLGDIGGGNCTRLYQIWKRDLKFDDAQMPNFTAHSKADVKHSDMFIDVLEKYVSPGREQDVLDTAKESMDVHRAYFGGMAQTMSKAS